MQIVIDIPEEQYVTLNAKSQDAVLAVVDDALLIKAIKNGTPLDKIRERISLEKLGYPPSAGYYKAIVKVLQIIDKYKAEGEDENDRTMERTERSYH